MTSQQDSAASGISAGKDAGDGRKIYRMQAPLTLWWAWVALAVFCVGDLAIQGHNRGAVTPALVVVMITGLMYACALRPRVLADPDGLTVQNPLRDYRVPWGAVRGIYLGDSVDIQCARQPPKKDKTLHSWALSSSRKARSRARLKGSGGLFRSAMLPTQYNNQSGQYGRMPPQAQAALTQAPTQLIARELARLSEEAHERGVPEAVVTGQWVWQPLLAILIPAAAVAISALT